jgi:hypothetical protein
MVKASLTGLALVTVLMALAADQTVVEFMSFCECHGNHGEYRWEVKTDQEAPPEMIPGENKVKPSVIGKWAEPPGHFGMHTPRSGREKEWYEVRGNVVLVKAEADGDLHIQLADEDDPNSVKLVVEVPVKQHPGKSPWCDLRKTVFGWSKQNFPFNVTDSKPLSLTKHPTIRVQGKAFFDAQHGGKTPNRRSDDPQVAVWEIHPVMMLQEITP